MLFRLTVLFVWVILSAYPCYGDNGVWNPLNAPGFIYRTADVGIGYNYLGQRYIFLADSSGSGTTLRSSDDGNTWTAINQMEPSEIEVSRSYANIVILADVTTYGCNIRTTNDALNPYPEQISWNLMNNGLPTRTDFITNLALVQSSITNPEDMEYTAFVSFLYLNPDYNDMVYRTTNGGESWTSANFLPFYTSIEDVKVCQAFPQNVICCGVTGYDPIIYRSVNGGDAWALIGDYADFDPERNAIVKSVCMAPYDPNVIYALISDYYWVNGDIH